MKLNYIVSSFLAIVFIAHKAVSFETEAKEAILIDADTGEVLFEKNADQEMVPSSMTKIMTAYLAFDRIKRGEFAKDSKLSVSEKAWRMGGSRMFVNLNDQVELDDLLKGIIVQSGNDACVVVAEAMSGSEAAFAEEMTDKAKEMGATHTNFVNSTGWPDDGHYSSPRDLAIIAQHIINEFPDDYAKYFAIREFKFNDINQGNRNPLLYESSFEADGLKTGSTDAGGYGLVGSAKKDGRRLILVVNGLPKMKNRAVAARELMAWGFSEFKNVKPFTAMSVAKEVDVWGGDKPKVAIGPKEDVVVTVPRRKSKEVDIKLIYDAPLEAPIKAGQNVGKVVVVSGEEELKTFHLYALQDVEKAGFFKRISNSISYLIWGNQS